MPNKQEQYPIMPKSSPRGGGGYFRGMNARKSNKSKGGKRTGCRKRVETRRRIQGGDIRS